MADADEDHPLQVFAHNDKDIEKFPIRYALYFTERKVVLYVGNGVSMSSYVKAKNWITATNDLFKTKHEIFPADSFGKCDGIVSVSVSSLRDMINLLGEKGIKHDEEGNCGLGS